MTQEQKDKWIEALRIGEYKQFKGALCDVKKTKHCCIDVCRIVLGTKAPIVRNSTGPGMLFGDEGDTIFRGVTNLSEGEINTLAGMNDSGKSFSEIADYIELNIEATE